MTKSGPKGIHVDGNCKQLKVTSNTVVTTKQHGIVIRDCDGSTISNNNVSKVPERGISIQDSLKVVASGNTVSSKGDAMYVAGESEKNYCSVTIKNNTLDSSGSNDLRLSWYAYKCKIFGNKLKNDGFSYSADKASYTGSVS